MARQLVHSVGEFKGALVVALLNVTDVASILGLMPKTVNKLVREKKLACVQVTARDRRLTTEHARAPVRRSSITGLVIQPGRKKAERPQCKKHLIGCCNE
jgi:hypothetical protein